MKYLAQVRGRYSFRKLVLEKIRLLSIFLLRISRGIICSHHHPEFSLAVLLLLLVYFNFFVFLSHSYDESYRSLLETMIKNDLALKGNFDGVELLIFPSNHLAEKSQRKTLVSLIYAPTSVVFYS